MIKGPEVAFHRKTSRLSHLNPIRPRGDDFDVAHLMPHDPAPSDVWSKPMEENYHLVRMDTNRSLDSSYSVQSQYKVGLNLAKKDIEMIRYTWNIMLLDEEVVTTKLSLPIPGGFHVPHALKEKSMSYINKTSASTVASSLFCRQFYSNLLSKEPTLEQMFPSIRHQAVAFAGVMSFAISQLENLSVLDDYLTTLGKRHSRILGIEPCQFELMGEALIDTFHERFGTKFTKDLEILWIKLYMYLSNSLLQFGIDPVLRLDDEPRYSRHLSVLDHSTIHDLMDKRLSISTDRTSVGRFDTPKPSPKQEKPLPQLQAQPAGLRDSIKKRKRDCTIM